MPHIDITMYPGRDDAVKQTLADKVAHFVADELSIPLSVVTVSIEDVAKDKWDEHVRSYAATTFVKPQN